MKRLIALIIAVCTIILSALMLNSCDFGGGTIGGSTIGGGIGSGNNGGNTDYIPNCSTNDHLDKDNDKYCDLCNEYVIVVIDFYVLNDLHGKFCETNTQPGVEGLATYLKAMEQSDDNVVIMSSGDMWQGAAESNLTSGVLITEWMNEMNFVSMTLGNHEFDWGEEKIRENYEIAEFPFLAINIYNNRTNTLADYCTPSVMIERDGVKIGIIGAIGDCYSSISSDMVKDVNFKVGRALTSLVKAESDRLRAEGADLIVYSLHDGYSKSSSGTTDVTSSRLSSYYDTVLSEGYVDLVFEAHSHQRYTFVDPEGVYHIQAGGENSGLSHVEIEVNSANGNNKVTDAGFVSRGSYGDLQPDESTVALKEKYSDVISMAYDTLGIVSSSYTDAQIEDYVASMYLKAGMAKWGDEYDIVLGGGFLRTRSPYDLTAGEKTYADILSLFPFDNSIVLCSVSGYNLKNRFIYNTSSDYHTALSDYGSFLNNISDNQIYYVVVDTYTAYYSQNGLSIVEFYDNNTFARDLLADAIRAGYFEVKHNDYQLTSITDALNIGNKLGSNQATTEYHYIKGTVIDDPNATYGNLYLVDENGNEIYVYGLYDNAGNRYDSMSNPPKKGDTIIVYSTIYKYVNGSNVTIELKNAIFIEKN